MVIALRYLLPVEDFLTFKRRLARLMDKFVYSNAMIDEGRLRALMGSPPPNWKSMTRYEL